MRFRVTLKGGITINITPEAHHSDPFHLAT